MGYNIVLERYQGPLDLLLDLIKKNEIDIYDIPIFKITEQFLDYMDKASKINLELTSDFILMASTLLEIKSKMLLPKTKLTEDDEEPEDAREELVKKLLEYEKYKEITNVLKLNEEYETKALYRLKSDFFEFSQYELLKDSNIDDLSKSFLNILKRNANKQVKSIYRESFSIEAATDILINILNKENKFYFTKLINEYSSREELISFFLAMLELIKINFINAKQKNNFSDILIRVRNVND